MDFVIRFLILTVITFTVLSVATEKWAKHYVWLIIGGPVKIYAQNCLQAPAE